MIWKLEIRKVLKNVVEDHLSRLITSYNPDEHRNVQINEEFPDEHLFAIDSIPWVADIAN